MNPFQAVEEVTGIMFGGSPILLRLAEGQHINSDRPFADFIRQQYARQQPIRYLRSPRQCP